MKTSIKTIPLLFTIQSFGFSIQGKKRKRNEDYWMVSNNKRSFFVSDGIGGKKRGEIASQTAISHLDYLFAEYSQSKKKLIDMIEIDEWIQKCMKTIHQEVQRCARYYEVNQMGATISFGHIFYPYFIYGSIGDSRIYEWDLRSKTLQLLTKDHVVKDLFKKSKNIEKKKLKLTRAIGLGKNSQADVGYRVLQPNNFYLLCTDGLYHAIHSDMMIDIFHKSSSPKEAIKRIHSKCIQKKVEDDATGVLVHVNSI